MDSPTEEPQVATERPEHEVAKVLIVTTGHLKPGERDRLFGEDGLPARAQLAGEFGAMLWVPPEGQSIFDKEDGESADSEGLAGCLKIAREQGCRYVLFDSDGSYYHALPDYDEEPDHA